MSTSSENQPLFWSAVAGVAAIGASFAARSILSRSWERTFQEPTPRNPGLSDVPVSRALMWAMASAGVAAGARLAARALTARVQERVEA
ncbi:MAG: DUF4235 domain-containing protein [Gemmatimonadota bacterium]